MEIDLSMSNPASSRPPIPVMSSKCDGSSPNLLSDSCDALSILAGLRFFSAVACPVTPSCVPADPLEEPDPPDDPPPLPPPPLPNRPSSSCISLYLAYFPEVSALKTSEFTLKARDFRGKLAEIGAFMKENARIWSDLSV